MNSHPNQAFDELNTEKQIQKEINKKNPLKEEFNTINKKRNDLLLKLNLTSNPTSKRAFTSRLEDLDEELCDVYRMIITEDAELTTEEIMTKITTKI